MRFFTISCHIQIRDKLDIDTMFNHSATMIGAYIG